MNIFILHPEAQRQPVAAALAAELGRALPPPARVRVAEAGAIDPAEADLVLAVFSLKPGAFAPLAPGYRDIRDTKVGFVALLAGPVDGGRVRKTVWGSKKRFCGNEMVGAYLCPTDDDQLWGPTAEEVVKAQAFALRLYEEHRGSASWPADPERTGRESAPDSLAVNF